MFRIIRAFRNNGRDFQKQRLKGFVVVRRMPLQKFSSVRELSQKRRVSRQVR